jgi:hypothetical protein
VKRPRPSTTLAGIVCAAGHAYGGVVTQVTVSRLREHGADALASEVRSIGLHADVRPGADWWTVSVRLPEAR